MKMSMEHWWNDRQGKIEELETKPIPVSLCPPQNSNGTPWNRTWTSGMRGRQQTA